jgi:MoaA/NifB/PqqE/SkfB family radical SAM enzyme
MRSDRIYTNRSCNQACTYCTVRAASDDPRAIAGGVMRRQVDDLVARGVREIVFTGGEPTMRRDLADLVRHARTRGAERVVVETNATLLDDARARELSLAGVDLFRVNLAGFGDALDAVTRDPGGFRRTLAGLLALSGAGAAVEIAAAIVRSTAPLLPDLPAGLADALGSARGLTFVLSTPTESPDLAELIPYDEAAAVIARVDQAARRVGIRLRLAPDHRPPPCCFPNPGRVAHAFTLAPGGGPRPDRRRVEACASCVVADRCDGFPAEYLARRPLPPIRPVTEDRLRRRLSLATPVDEQIAHELVTRNTRRGDGSPVDDHIVRVNFHCNQSCEFCFVSTHLPAAEDEAVVRAIESAGRAGARVTLSGGEPTLNPRLAEYVKLAKASSPWPVEIQTNAVLLDDPGRVRALVEAGLTEAFVSLHGATAETSDAVTGAPGTFARSVVGLDNLIAAGVRVMLNYVICQANHAEIVPYVRMVAARWPGARVSISFVSASRDIVPQTARLVPRYSDALPHLAAALDEAPRLGVDVVGFESMCGLPLCLVPSGQGAFAALPPVTDGDDDVFVKPEPCARCALEPRCYGVRRRYVELHGASELSPVPAGAGVAHGEGLA